MGGRARTGPDHVAREPPRSGRSRADDGHPPAGAGRSQPVDGRPHRGCARRRFRARSDLRIRADRAVGLDTEPADRLGRALAAAGDEADVPGAAGHRGRARRPSHVLPQAARWRSRRPGTGARGSGHAVLGIAAAPAAPAGPVRRPDLRRRGRPSAHAPRAAGREGPDRRRRDRRVRLASADRWAGAGHDGARVHRRDRQSPVELQRVPGHVPAGVVTRALAGHASAVPHEPRPRPSRRRPGRLRGVLGRGADQRRTVPHRAPGGPARARQRPVADDLRRPRDHRRLEHRPPMGERRLRQGGRQAGSDERTPGLRPVPALGQQAGRVRDARITGTPRARRGGDRHVRCHPGQPGHGLRAAVGGPGGSPAGRTTQPGAA